MNTRRSARINRTSPKRKIETDSDSSDSSVDAISKNKTKISPKRNKSETDISPNDKLNKKSPKRKHESEDDDGNSSDSSVGDYLKNPDEIDLSSSFFTATSSNSVADKPPDFNTIEKRIFGDVQRLSDDDDEDSDHSENENENISETITQADSSQKTNFSQLREYNRKLEEAKACVERYENSKKVAKKSTENSQEIKNLLKLGETKNESHEIDDLEDSDDENEMDWEEIETKEKTEDKINIPKDGVQITVELPQNIRQKPKGVDMMTAIKRRINRVKKENQVYVHKVHLLCWIAHGNFVNTILNDTELLAPALSLLPSDKCYPPKHADMSYLEQIVKWYGKIIKVIPKEEQISLKEGLQKAISNKTACSTRDYVLIFIIILRALGLQCRLILSFQCLPLRPPASELCSLSTKETKPTENKASSSKTNKKGETETKAKTSSSSKKSNTKTENKSTSSKSSKTTNKSSKTSNTSKDRKSQEKKSADKPKTQEKKPTRSSKTKPLTISQVDGADDDEETFKKRNKPSIRIKLKQNLDDSVSSTSEIITLNNKKKKFLEVEDEDFKPRKRSPTGKSPKDINGNKKSDTTKLKSPSVSSSSSLKKSPIKKESSVSSSSSLKKSSIKKESNASPKPSTSTSPRKSDHQNPVKIEKTSPKLSPDKKLSEKLQNQIKIEKTSPKVSSKKLSENLQNQIKIEKTSPKVSTRKLSEKLRSNQTKIENTSPKISPKKLSERIQSTQLKIENISPKASASTSNYFNKTAKTNVTNDIINLIKGDMSQKRTAEQHLKAKVKPKARKEDPDYDSDYFPDESEVPEKPVKKPRKSYNSEDEFKYKVNTNVRRKPKAKNDTRVLSSDDESEDGSVKKKKKGNDVWVEVFLEEEEKWISVDVVKGQIHCVSELHSRASQPVSYIIAWNNDLSLKDITARYCPNWNTVTRKLRVDSAWWQQTLRPFLGVKNARDKEEDEDLARQQLDKPLPTSIAEYKNHPLYVLKRHLLKFEALYPPDALTLGFIRNEAVYARECVHTLHSREIWVKHAKVVKPAQEPYKIVKARPKYDKLSGKMITDLPLELFGSWQVEDYVPPTAENGVVPRNAFGNVELFKACMLPFKTVHLQLPGLNKICRKLQIDCAPAVVGFDFHSGYSHPMFDGYVVCEEFKDTVIAAWEQDQLETAKKEQEKYEKRVWGNWRKLIKAALIRERLKARYDFGPVQTEPKTKGKKKSTGPKVVLKKRKICSDNEDDDWSDVE